MPHTFVVRCLDCGNDIRLISNVFGDVLAAAAPHIPCRPSIEADRLCAAPFHPCACERCAKEADKEAKHGD